MMTENIWLFFLRENSIGQIIITSDLGGKEWKEDSF